MVAPAPEAGTDRVTSDSTLAAALANGPFDEALRLAIEHRGLSLHQLHNTLRERGADISIPSLSHWQRGRSQPERPGSLRALSILEEMLGLSTDALRALLGPPRQRGRWFGSANRVPTHRLWADHEYAARLDRVLASLGASPDDGVTKISRYEESFCDAEGRLAASRHRDVLRAYEARVDRCVQIQYADDLVSGVPTFRSPRHCRIGRQRGDEETGFAAAEMIFDRVLQRGDLTAIDYEVSFPTARTRLDSLDRRFTSATHEYVCQLTFHPAAVPARCFQSTRRPGPDGPVELRELWLGPSRTVELVLLDCPPGIYGIRIEWE